MSELRDLYVVKNIRASRVNLIMNDFAAGLPSPLSFIGLGDLISRRLGLEPWSARAIPVLHDVQISEGRTKPEMERNERRKKGEPESFVPIETMEDLTGTVDLSLLLHLPGCESESALREQMTGLRIAGGLIQNNKVSVSAVTPDGSAFRGLRRGYAMIRPDQQERRFITSGDLSPDQVGLRRIAELLFPAKRPPGFGWVVPCSVGYRLLEDPEKVPQRIRTRSKEIPHVYAEPVLGIAELVSVRNSRLTGLTMAGLDDLFWSWDAREDLILGHSAYYSQTNTSCQIKESPHG